MALAAYNGGLGGLAQDRRLCRATPGCDQSKWTGHVEKTSYKAKIAVKGYGKSFFEINREYVRNVMNIRKAKYTGYFKPELQT
jgi:membrane-bound lytic murein transglycosylase MltF